MPYTNESLIKNGLNVGASMSISICCSTSKIFIKNSKKLINSHMYVQPNDAYVLMCMNFVSQQFHQSFPLIPKFPVAREFLREPRLCLSNVCVCV